MENIKFNSIRKIMWVSDKETFEENFKKTNNKIIKLGVEPMTFTYFDGSEFDVNTESWMHNIYVNYLDEVCGVEITYPTIKNISGIDCTFVGSVSLENCSEKEKQFHFDNEKDFQNIKNMNLTCVHCGKKISRNKYFYFKKSDDSYIALGRTCAKEYFPFDPDKLISFVDFIICDNFGDYEDFIGFGKSKYVSLDDLFDLTSVATNDFTNWVSKDKEDFELPTKTKIERMMCDLSI